MEAAHAVLATLLVAAGATSVATAGRDTARQVVPGARSASTFRSAREPSLAADSARATTRIAFISSRRGRFGFGNNRLYVVNADGSGRRLLTRQAWQELSWSPDGAKIAFLSVRDRNSEIYVVRAYGGGQRRLTRSSDFEFFPSWSPDGRKIAFGSLRGGPQGRSEIYVMNADGGGRRLLTADGQDPIRLPGGRLIAFTRIPAGPVPFEFLIINSDGSGERNLTRKWGIDNGPAWSPDGQKIVFGSSRDGNPEIYVMNADGTGVRRLTRNPADDVDHWWSSDGRRIAFVRQTASTVAIYVMSANGSGQREACTESAAPALVARWADDRLCPQEWWLGDLHHGRGRDRPAEPHAHPEEQRGEPLRLVAPAGKEAELDARDQPARSRRAVDLAGSRGSGVNLLG